MKKFTVKDIIKIIKTKETMHRLKYKEFTTETGCIMNGHLIKAETCKEILEIITKTKD